MQNDVKSNVANKSQSFLQGAMILTLAVAASKVINALYKVPLLWILGGEGFGYFSSAFSLYSMLYSLATAGFPIAIARLVSENLTKKRFKDVHKVHKVSIPLFICTGLIGFSVMIGGAFIYIRCIHQPNAIYSILALAPAVFFYCLISIYRGYYEGMRNMLPTAISTVIEDVVKLIVGLTCSYSILTYLLAVYKKTGLVFGVYYDSFSSAKSAILPFAAAGAIFGTTFGAFVAFLFLLIRHKKIGDGISNADLEKSPKSLNSQETFKKLARIAIPVALGTLVLNSSNFIDSTLIQNRLAHLLSTNEAAFTGIYQGLISQSQISVNKLPTTLWGDYSIVYSIMMIIPAFTAQFGVSALPSVTSAWTKGDKLKIKKSLESVLRITTFITIPSGIIFSSMAKPIMEFISLKSNNSFEVAAMGDILIILGIAGIFYSTATPIMSMLQAVGRVDLPVKLLSIGVVIKVFINYTFVSIPSINIHGAGTGTLVAYIFVTLISLYCLCKETKVVPDMISIFVKPILASIVFAISSRLIYSLIIKFVMQRISIIIALAIGAVIYIIVLFLIKGIAKEDILMLPKGKKIAKVLENSGLLR